MWNMMLESCLFHLEGMISVYILNNSEYYQWLVAIWMFMPIWLANFKLLCLLLVYSFDAQDFLQDFIYRVNEEFEQW